MGVDDVVAELELDVFDLPGDLCLIGKRCFVGYLWRNDALLRCDQPFGGP